MSNRYVWAVLSNPVDGQETAYNDWYDNQHLDDLMRCPGILTAQRFSLADRQRAAGPHPYRYLAMYDVETDDLGRFYAEMAARTASGDLPISPALGERLGLVFQQIGERRSRKI